MVDLIGDFLVSVALLRRRKHVKPYRYKTIAIRPAECEHSKSFLIFMLYMVIYPGKKLNGFTPIPFDDRIIQDKHLDSFRSGKSAECAGYLYGKEQKGLSPVERRFVQKTIISVLVNRLFPASGMGETEKIFILKY